MLIPQHYWCKRKMKINQYKQIRRNEILAKVFIYTQYRECDQAVMSSSALVIINTDDVF